MVDLPASTWPMKTTLTCSLSVVLAAWATGFFLTLDDFLSPESSSMELSSSSGVVAGLLISALSSQLSPASSAAAFSGFEVGGSTCIGAGSAACTGAAGFSAAGCAGAGSAGSQEGVKAGALTLGTKL